MALNQKPLTDGLFVVSDETRRSIKLEVLREGYALRGYNRPLS